MIHYVNADMRATARSWPDHIERPGAFLASRLRRLPRTPSAPPPASAATRATDIAYFRAHRRSGTAGLASGAGETLAQGSH
jgi:hypothetical protein